MNVKENFAKSTFSYFRLPERDKLCKQLKNSNLLNNAVELDRKIYMKYNLQGHQGIVYSLIRLPDGNLASGSSDSTIRLWDWNNDYNCLKVIQTTGIVMCLLSLPDGNLASGANDWSIRIFDKDYECIRLLKEHGPTITSLILVGDKMLSGSLDGTIRVWDLTDYNCIKVLKLNGWVKCLMSLSDGYFASVSNFKIIQIWDINKDCNCVSDLRGHSEVTSLVLLEDGVFAAGSADDTIKIWSRESSWKDTYCVKVVLVDAAVRSMITFAGSYLAVALEDNTIVMLNILNDYKCVRKIVGDNDKIYELLLLPDDNFASCSEHSIKIRGMKYNNY
jgi:WD40 repeat protein